MQDIQCRIHVKSDWQVIQNIATRAIGEWLNANRVGPRQALAIMITDDPGQLYHSNYDIVVFLSPKPETVSSGVLVAPQEELEQVILTELERLEHVHSH